MPVISIVVPVLDEAADIAAALAALQPLRAAGAELVVVDGGSRDGTVALATPLADRVIVAPRGRASQMNAGAAQARGDVLLFLHADTRLPEGAQVLIADALRQGAEWGRFDVRIEGDSMWLQVVAALMNRRSRLTGIATGDQAMFMTRAIFDAVGGFPAIPLMEDIELSKRLRRRSRPACLAARVTTSGRRWERHGVWRTILTMWRLRLCHFLGADLRQLAREYGYLPVIAEPVRVAVAVLARAPIPGQAKTRLIPALGADGAAELQRWLLQRTVAMALAADVGPVTLWCDGDPQHPDFAHYRAFGSVAMRHQPEGDLGERMLVALRESPTDATLVIGTDCPALTATHLREAAQALADHDAVLLPAEDGGYVLIGAICAEPSLFADVDWGTERVMAQTRERLRTAGLLWCEPATLWDMDRPTDLDRLAALGPEAAAFRGTIAASNPLREAAT